MTNTTLIMHYYTSKSVRLAKVPHISIYGTLAKVPDIAISGTLANLWTLTINYLLYFWMF